MGMAPYLEITCRERYRLVMRDAQDVYIRDAGEPAADKDRVRPGGIVVAGQDISGRPPRDLGAFRRAHVGFVFQFFNLVPTLTAYENYAADQIPVLWMPQPVYQISEISKNLHGTLPQSPIESLTPEDWYLTK